MPAFDYVALTSLGARQRGVTEAESEQQARQRLRDQGLTPLSVHSSQRSKNVGPQRSFSRGVRLTGDQVVLFTRLLGTLLQSGLPLDDALTALSKQSESADFKRIALDIRARVLEGHGLAAGLEQFPRIFPPVYRATIAAGAQTRHLPTVLSRLAAFMEERRRVRQRLQVALIYPVVLTVVALAVVTGLLAYVVPEVVKVFDQMNHELPAITRLMIGTSALVRQWGWTLAAGVVLLIMAIRVTLARPHARLIFDRLCLHLPLLGVMLREADAGRFARTLAILLGSGLAMLDALHIAAKSIVNAATQEQVDDAIERVREGVALSQGLVRVSGFPPLLAHLVASGEKSGELPRMLDSAAEAHESSMQLKIAVMLGLAEPLLILLMGAIVLVIVLAILLPIFDMNQLV